MITIIIMMMIIGMMKIFFFERYDSCEKWKAQKASIKEELLPIAWHPSRWWD